MGIPAVQTARLAGYILQKKLSGTKRYPLVLMLEPLFACNLRCKGCGKIAYPGEIMAKRLSVDECVQAARECGAPVVAIPGGEPLLHPDIVAIVQGLMADKRFVYMCTNAQLLKDRLDDFASSPYFTFNVHLDGLPDIHDSIVCKPGAYETSVEAMREAVKRGFRVTTNTTFYAGQTPQQAAEFFDRMMDVGLEGLTISAAFSYESAADQEHFMTREMAIDFFQKVFALGKGKKWRFNHSSLYLDFLTGKRDFPCTPWGNPARSVLGWQRPCYLLDDGYAETYQDLMEHTDWDSYGTGNNTRCTNCMVHCGFEPSAVIEAANKPWLPLLAAFR